MSGAGHGGRLWAGYGGNMAASKSASRKSAARKAAKSRKPRAASRKTAKPAGTKAAATRKSPVAGKKAVKSRKAKAAMRPAAKTGVAEVDVRIAIIRANLRELVEQAASNSGAANEELMSQRIADQEEKLQLLLKQRDKLSR